MTSHKNTTSIITPHPTPYIPKLEYHKQYSVPITAEGIQDQIKQAVL
jgi:hypothetical protein